MLFDMPISFLVLLFVSIFIMMYLLIWFTRFRNELIKLNRLIRRSRGSDRKHWKNQKRRLYLSIIPFVKY